MAVSSQLEELMSNRDVKNGDEQQKLFEIIKGEEPEQCGQIIYPIICEGDVIGSVIVLAKDENNKVSVTEQKTGRSSRSFPRKTDGVIVVGNKFVKIAQRKS